MNITRAPARVLFFLLSEVLAEDGESLVDQPGTENGGDAGVVGWGTDLHDVEGCQTVAYEVDGLLDLYRRKNCTKKIFLTQIITMV